MTLCLKPPMATPDFRIEAPGTPLSIRTILAELRCRLVSLGVAQDQCGRVEIALAEALNNIVEHAYDAGQGGPVRLYGTFNRGRLDIALHDRGPPLPGLRPPDPRLPDSSGPTETLPEGGFGWYLIHDLTDTLIYRRDANENCLCLGFEVDSDEG